MHSEISDVLKRLVAACSEDATSDYDLNADSSGMVRSNEGLRPSAVLIGVRQSKTVPEILLTRRNSDLRHHPGQISFPGGKMDATDASPVSTALRESREEVGLRGEGTTIIGQLPSHETVTGFSIAPIIATIDPHFLPVPEPGEVAEAFFVPLTFAMNPANTRIESRMFKGHPRRYYVISYGPYYIWGATARILVALQAGWARIQ